MAVVTVYRTTVLCVRDNEHFSVVLLRSGSDVQLCFTVATDELVVHGQHSVLAASLMSNEAVLLFATAVSNCKLYMLHSHAVCSFDCHLFMR